jgi:hypothetical protein
MNLHTSQRRTTAEANGAHQLASPLAEQRSNTITMFWRRIWTLVPRRLRYLFVFYTLAFVAISIAFNMVFTATQIIKNEKIPLHDEMNAPTAMTTNKTIAVYICNDLYNQMQIRKVQELQSYFGKDLIVVTDEKDIRDDWILPAEQVISQDSNISLTRTKALNYYCCGIERSLMWLVQNRDYYDYAWVMEDDVMWSNFTDLKDFFQSYSDSHDDTDLLHSNLGMEEHSFHFIRRWWPYKFLLPPYVSTEAKFDRPFHEGYFQFYRASSRFVAALDDWRHSKNNGEWTFFEPLFANLAFRNDMKTTKLTTKNFINNPIGYAFHIEWRPCFTMEQVYNISASSNGGRGGLFHPVKNDARSSSKDCMQQPRLVLQQTYIKHPRMILLLVTGLIVSVGLTISRVSISSYILPFFS